MALYPRREFLLIARLLTWSAILWALGSSSASAQYRFDVWTADTGLPQNSVYSITQTRDGYLWFTTLDGLVRFDGVRFVVFNKGNTRGIESNRFTWLIEDDQGDLWGGTEDGGVTRYSQGEFRTYTKADHLPSNWILSIQKEPDGHLLIYTAEGLIRWKDERFIAFSPRAGEAGAMAIYADPSGDLWYSDRAGLHRASGDRIFNYPIPFPELSSVHLRMHRDRDGDLWIGALSGKLYRIRGDLVTVYTAKDGLPGRIVYKIFEDRDGTLWFGTGGGLVRFQNERFTLYTTAQGLASDNVRDVYEDREGTVWVGTGDRGLNRLTRQTIHVYSSRDGMTSDNLYPIYEDRAGRIWIGANELIKLENGSFTVYSQKDGLPTPIVSSIYEDREGRLWVSTMGNVSWLKDGKLTRFTEKLGVGFNYLSAIHQDREGNFWFGTDVGLIKVTGESRRLLTTDDGLPGNDIRVIHEDRRGDLWIGTYGGLAHLSGGRFTAITSKDGLASDRVRAIYEDQEGALWIGTYDGGMSRLKDGRLTGYTTREGLFSDGVFQILEDNRGNFWMSSNQGIYRVSRRELDDLAEGRIRQVTSVPYGKQDGLLNIECNGGRSPAGVRAGDGRLWFPTQQGAAVIDPETVSVNPQPPPVVIETVTVDRSSIGRHGFASIEIGPEKQNLEIHYTGLSFIKTEHVRFRYRLEGLDDDWVDVGTRRTAYYSHLPPGSYTFTVLAANSDGVWNVAGASIQIVARPPFWKTWWFTLIAALSVAALSAAVYRWRVAHLSRAKAAQETFSRQLIASQESERKRIAAELHDSLGQSLAIIKNLALLGRKSPSDGNVAREQFDRITLQSTQAIDEVKDISYNLRPYLLDRLGFRMAVESMINKVADASGIEFSARIDELDGALTKDHEIDLYRIVQESVNNIVKHAEANRATVEIRRDHHEIGIEVRDNGRGFAVEATYMTEKMGRGFGLFGMAERAKLLGGNLIVRSAPGQGTAVNVRIPIRGRE